MPSVPGARAWQGIGQLVGGLAVYVCYLFVTKTLPINRADASGRGWALLRAERAWSIDVEPSMNRWLTAHHTLGMLASWEYATAYIFTTFLVLGWLWWRRPDYYPRARNQLVLISILAIGCFALWPTTPPRLLAHSGFVDVVTLHHPALSWGSGAVSAHSDQFAAMPSLHVGWAVWVAVSLFGCRASIRARTVSVLNLGLTVLVVLSTANHYVLDAVAGAALVGLAALVTGAQSMIATRSQPPGVRVAAPDEFFLHVESKTVQQPVGGVAWLRRSTARGPITAEAMRELVAVQIGDMPRFSERLQPAGLLRHARWVHCDVDLADHIKEIRLADDPGLAGPNGLAKLVGRLAEQELDRSRPMWQLWIVPDAGEDRAALIAIMHHSFADGLGVVDILRQIIEPLLPPPDLSAVTLPPWPVRAAGIATGVAQLARDGRAQPLAFTRPLSGHRTYSMAQLPLEPVRAAARNAGMKLTDLLLAAIGEAMSTVLEERGAPVDGKQLRAAVPVTTRLPAPPGTTRTAQPGNLTAALRIDVPLGRMNPMLRAMSVARTADAVRRSGRALATTAVMRLIGVLPPPLHGLAARAMYRGRYFTAIVSNMPGPVEQLWMANAEMVDVYPIIPLAEQVPLGVGTLGWAGRLCVSVVADTDVLPEADTLADRIVTALRSMAPATSEVGEGNGATNALSAGDAETVPS
ncbi:MAG: hypothetical protein JWN95_1554 [Frankiales bacterium]|nr:hypothetical protein [Frankiales bacterium]